MFKGNIRETKEKKEYFNGEKYKVYKLFKHESNSNKPDDNNAMYSFLILDHHYNYGAKHIFYNPVPITSVVDKPHEPHENQEYLVISLDEKANTTNILNVRKPVEPGAFSNRFY